MTKSRSKIRSLPLACCLVAGLALFLADAGLADTDRDFEKPKVPSRQSVSGSSSKGASPPARSGGSRGTATRSNGPRSNHSGDRAGSHPRQGRRSSEGGGSRDSGHRSYGHSSSRAGHHYRGHHNQGHHYRGYGSYHRHYAGCGHYGSYSHGYGYGGIGFYPYYGYYGYGWWPSVEVYRHRPYYAGGGRNLGALDLDIQPEKAEVFVDGRYVGVADNFDGFPSYLWLEEGSYEVSFYREGFETLTREIAVTPTATIGIDDRMTPGDAVKPEPIAKAADAGNSDWARKEDEWRDRAREYRSRRENDQGSDVGSGAEVFDTRGEPGRLQLTVAPRDASVYLDGRFLGSAGELGRLHSGLIVSPGEHGLEVVRPGYESRTVTFSVDEGKEVEVDVQLEAAAGEA